MRKASHDGGDSTSITSGVENETKKSAMKSKKTSLKRKVPSFNQESDDTVIEPLLQKDKDKPEFQSAKSYGNAKTDLQNKESDTKAKKTGTTEFCGTTESLLSFKDSETTKTTAGAVSTLHNYMNTNVFNTHDNAKVNTTTKSKILVEIDSTKQSSYTPSPLIFTTAKIHTDARAKNMEPVQVTPAPILSTIEVSMSKGGNISTNDKKVIHGSSVINPVYSPIPLNKGKDEKVTGSCFTTVNSQTSKDSFGNGVTVASSVKLANVTTAHSSSIKISLPSSTSNSLIMKSNNNNKQGDIKDVKREQTLPQLTCPLDNTKNNVAGNKIIPASQKNIDNSTISVKTAQHDRVQTQKTGGYENVPLDKGTNSSQTFTSNNKTPSSMNSVGISSISKNMTSTVGNKQLQRQKTTTEDIIDSGPKADTGNEHFENLSAKHASSVHPKIIDSISNIDELSDISANNSQSATTKYTADSISKTTPISTTTKPNITAMATSNTVTTFGYDPSKPSITSTISNMGKIVSPNTTSANAISNANSVSTASTIRYNNYTNKDNTAQTTSNISTKCTEATSTQTQPQKSIIVTIPEKVPVANVSKAKTTGTASSAKSKTIKQSPATSTNIASTISTQPLSNSTTKFADSKLPFVTTSAKTSTANPNTSIAIKPSSNTATEMSSSSVAAVNAPAASKLIPKTLSSAAVCSVPASITASVKSPNNNSTLVFGVSKPSTTNTKTEPVKAVSKTSAGTLSTNVTVSTFKSPQGISATKANTKDSSLKKPAVTKTSVATKSSVSSANKPVVGTSTKTSTTDASSTLSSAAKKPVAAVSTKTSSVTTSAKTPLVSSTKTPDETSSNTVTTSSAAIKPTTSATQVSANKSVGIAVSSVPSFTPALRQSESVKKGGPKSSANNKDGRVSKA